MLPINYHHLYYFWMTARLGSISRAREQLLLAQPTLSLQIRSLEKALGKRLLERHRTGVTLTPDGQAVFEHCERIFAEGDQLLREVRGGGRPEPRVRLGAAPSVSRESVLLVLDRLREARRGLASTILSGSPAELEEKLRRRAVDLAISDSELRGPGQRGRLGAALPVIFVAAPRLAARLRGFPRKGQEVPMLFRPPEHPVRRQAEGYLSRHGARVTVAAVTDDAELIRVLCRRGEGVAALSVLAIGEDVRQGRLRSLNRRPSGVKESVWLSRAAGPHSDPEVEKALATLESRPLIT